MLFHLLDALGGVDATRCQPVALRGPDRPVGDLDRSLGAAEEIGLSDQGPLNRTRGQPSRTFLSVYDAGGDGEPINMFGRADDPLPSSVVSRRDIVVPRRVPAVQMRDVECSGGEACATRSRGQSRAPGSRSTPRRRSASSSATAGPRLRERLVPPTAATSTTSPVDLVMETLPKRRGDLPVSRGVLVCHVRGGRGRTRGALSAPLRSAVDLVKVVTLPARQTIGGEIDRIKASPDRSGPASELQRGRSRTRRWRRSGGLARARRATSTSHWRHDRRPRGRARPGRVRGRATRSRTRNTAGPCDRDRVARRRERGDPKCLPRPARPRLLPSPRQLRQPPRWRCRPPRSRRWPTSGSA